MEKLTRKNMAKMACGCGITNALSSFSLVESEAFVRAFSPGSTLEPGLKAFRRRGPKCPLETPPLLVQVGTTNRD
jgi:hypothetical protein